MGACLQRLLEFNLEEVENCSALFGSLLSLLCVRPAGLRVLRTLQHLGQAYGLQDPAHGRGPGQDVRGLQRPRSLHGYQQHHARHTEGQQMCSDVSGD